MLPMIALHVWVCTCGGIRLEPVQVSACLILIFNVLWMPNFFLVNLIACYLGKIGRNSTNPQCKSSPLHHVSSNAYSCSCILLLVHMC